MNAFFELGLADGIIKVAVSDSLVQRVADERLWRQLSGGAKEKRKLERNTALNAERHLRRSLYAPPQGPQQQFPRPRAPRPGESTAEGMAKRERRFLRGVVAKKNDVDPRSVITDEAGKKVLHVPKKSAPVATEIVSAARQAAKSSAEPEKAVAAVIAKKSPMSAGMKAALVAAGLLTTAGIGYGINRALTPKRYDNDRV